MYVYLEGLMMPLTLSKIVNLLLFAPYKRMFLKKAWEQTLSYINKQRWIKNCKMRKCYFCHVNDEIGNCW